MPKSMVEKYEQILAEDPSSTVFVELAKVLIETGEHQKAIDVCRAGLSYRNDSVLGRVLWGKALIHLGRPALAMEQFEQAVAIDRGNAHGYYLVAEVLIQRGLYRSAVPLLRKASTLQPTSGQLRTLLEQTQKALSGGPAPVLEDLTELEPAPVAPSNEQVAVASASGQGVAEEEEAGDLTEIFDVDAVQKALEAKGGPRRPAQSSPAIGSSGPPQLERVVVNNGHNAGSNFGSFLLDEVPELKEAGSTPEVSKVQISKAATEAIADQYEKELRQRLDEVSSRKTFWQAHWGKVAVGAVVIVLLAVGLGSYLRTWSKNKGKDLKDAMAYAKKEIARDTPKSYRDALGSLNDALTMDDSTEEAWILSGYVRSILYAEYGGSSQDRDKAAAVFRRPAAQEKFAGLVIAGQYYLADASGKDVARKSVLAAGMDQTEIHELAGKILLSQPDNAKAALNRFDRALKLYPNNVRALAALGDYYRASGDCSNAISFYLRAIQVSAQHAASVVGAAECRLELNQDIEESLKQVESLPRSEDLPPALVSRRELARGRLLAMSGKVDEAIKSLTNGIQTFRSHAFEFTLALGEANRIHGTLNEAEKQFSNALKIKPQSEEAKEGLGRVLLARDLQRELLSRVPARPDSHKVSLVRGIAFAQLEEWRAARAELSHTQVNGKYPSEAVIYLSLADASQGQQERAIEILERTLASAKRARGDIRVALGTLYWRRGAIDKARAQFEEASKEHLDYEGACSLGRLLLKLTGPESAVVPLSQAVAHNPFHAEARHALSSAYLALGRTGEAVKALEGSPDGLSAQGQRNLASALYYSGRFKEAEVAIQRALKQEPDDVEGNRIRANTLFALGDAKVAMKALERANKLDPQDPVTFCEIGRGFMRLNNWEMASKAFAAARAKKTDLLCAIAGEHWAGLGAARRAGADKEIAGSLQTAHTAAERAFGLAVLSRLRLAAGNPGEAKKLAEEAVQSNPFGSEGHLALGLAAQRLKNDAMARDSLLKAVERDASLAAAHLALADFLSRGGADELPRAISEYEAFLSLSNGSDDEGRVRRILSNLKKRIAAR